MNEKELEDIYDQCKMIINNEVKAKLMGWIYRVLLKKSIQDGLFFCEYQGDKIIGFALCRKLTRSNVISIDKIGVDPQHRNKGIGGQLINKVKNLGLPIKLDVVARNKIAVQFYLKHGFNKTGSKILGHNVDVDIMSYTP